MTNKADYIESLSRYDRNKLEEYVATKELVQLCKEELEAEKKFWQRRRPPWRKRRQMSAP